VRSSSWHAKRYNLNLGKLIMKTINANYPVGYGRPPEQHQFQRGQSGNPTGRPKGARSVVADVRDESAELVSVKDGERTVELTQQRALIKALYKAGLGGDLRAANIVLNLCSQALACDAEQSTDDVDVDAADQAIAKASEERQRQRDDTKATEKSKM
jgi:hypothetical protein